MMMRNTFNTFLGETSQPTFTWHFLGNAILGNTLKYSKYQSRTQLNYSHYRNGTQLDHPAFKMGLITELVRIPENGALLTGTDSLTFIHYYVKCGVSYLLELT